MDLLRAETLLFVTALWVTTTAAPLVGQQTPPPRQPETPAVDVSKLPLDLHRIERQLRQSTERQEFEGLRLRYYVDVFGRAPQIELFAPGENLSNGPVPWGAPTHKQMLEVTTPIEFRSPPMDFSAFLRWLQNRSKK